MEEGRGKISCLCLLNLGRLHTQAQSHTCAQKEIGLELELLLLHFLTLRILQLTPFGCKSWGFVIYNQFSALVSSALACPFLQFVPCPEGPHRIPLLYRPCLSPFLLPHSFSLSASSPSLSSCTTEARRVCPSCASSGSCLPWYIMRERGSTAQHAHRALTTFAQVFHT